MSDADATKKGQALLSELEAELTPEPLEPPAGSSKLEDFLDGSSSGPAALEQGSPTRPAAPTQAVGIRSAQLTSLSGRDAEVKFRGSVKAAPARLAPEVEPRLVELALRNRDSVLVETEGEKLWVVGVLQVRLPERVELRAREVLIEAEQELTLRSGRAGARLRKDGDVELVGSRISAASRGLFRIVGRILRLN